MTTKPLTWRQTEAMDFIKSFIIKNTYPQTVREIAEHLDLESHSIAFCLLEQLVSKGYVKKGVGPRMIQVVTKQDTPDFSKWTEDQLEKHIIGILQKHGIDAQAEVTDIEDEVVDNRRAGRIELIFDVIVLKEVDQI
ncbi:hypothetical protein ACP8HI_07140 [Paenibacillus sp. FA6]|uniref:LexA family protein n=1 Tax=Paenibacillus sp. FA6 TaxID=3413029 RepID=UPI003F660B07